MCGDWVGAACGGYDPHKVGLLITQTGGGCRASNYIHLLRKALEKADMAYIPVVSVNLSGLEKNPGFSLTLPFIAPPPPTGGIFPNCCCPGGRI
mgnify:CR=1 FL=1